MMVSIWSQAKVERSDRIDKEERYRLLEGIVIDDTCQLNE